MKFLVRFLVIGILLAIAVGSWFTVAFLNRAPDPKNSAEIFFEVEPGQSFRNVAERLHEQGLITNVNYFIMAARISGQAKNVRVGQYSLQASMNPMTVLDTITSGKSVEIPITFQEGLNKYEMGEVFEREGLGKKEKFLEACNDPELVYELLGRRLSSFEGYLFPETYHVTKYVTAEELVRRMVKRFLTVYGEIQANYSGPLSRHEIVTLASVIEKETGAPHERPLISSVFHNRLKKDMRLQTDPTVLYGILDKTKKYRKNIRKSDLKAPSKYNTYLIKGLPYGPIANPGRKALLAAMTPRQSEYLFFVSKNDGTHTFSKTYEEHQAAVRRYQLNRRAREGRSWRDLSKKLGTLPEESPN